jgi:hypothetical protein
LTKTALRQIKTQRTVAQLLKDQQAQSLQAEATTASAAKELGAETHVVREGLDGSCISLPQFSELKGMPILLLQ